MRADFSSYSSSLGRTRLNVAMILKCAHIFEQISNEHGFRIIETMFEINHIHIVIDIDVSYSINQIIRLLK
jgi:REP element-mobilizing transposase RayT